MKELRLNFALCLVFLSLLFACSNAQYWFQFGARGGPESYFNNGAGASIKTIDNQSVGSGSLAFWIGENLQNNAFLQIGYLVENQSGQFPTNCNLSGCSDYETLPADEPVWFYEYFPTDYNKSFLGALGTPGSIGKNGTVNNYAFYSKGDLWYFVLNGNVLGSVNLSTGSSGNNDPVAFGELAATNGTWFYIKPVIFSNLTKYTGGNFLPLANGYSYIGYGIGSRTNIQDPYGVAEIGGRTDYFAVGSGLSQPSNDQLLWSYGYLLSILSQYGNLSSTSLYQPYHNAQLTSPVLIYVAPNIRENFTGWVGTGKGSYTGFEANVSLVLFSNITETILWSRQYLVNVSSQHSIASGSGWYSNTSVANYSIAANIVPINASSRFVFDSWTNGNKNKSGTVTVVAPVNLSAIWSKQYYANITSQYGNVSGSGWYTQGSLATFSLLTPVKKITDNENLAFYEWSNGSKNSSITTMIHSPIQLNAIYKEQYGVHLQAINVYGALVPAGNFSIDNKSVGNETYLFGNDTYVADSAFYKGQKLDIYSLVRTESPSNISIQLPLYPIVIHTQDVFGGPVNATATLEFSNGTVRGYNAGSNGTIVIDNVPYGQLEGPVSYFGLTDIITTTSGNTDIRVTFISIFDLEIFAVALIVSSVLFFLGRRRLDAGAKAKKMTYHK